MSAAPPWRAALEEATGTQLSRTAPVSGGDIGDSARVELADGQVLFVKHYPHVPKGASEAPGIAEAEARGLEWLADARVEELRIARPVAHGEDWLALEWIEPGAPAPDHDERLGRGLARLHAASPGGFGFPTSNWIARIPWSNEPCADWPDFYGERRLRPLAKRARDAGALPTDVALGLDRLIDALPELVGPDEPPARLHGDLWSGNAICDASGGPCLIDPEVYGGHREIDLAMMDLFGGFGPRVFAAYREIWPLAPGAEARVPLYQVLPLLVHVCLFGGGYVGGLARAIDDALRAG